MNKYLKIIVPVLLAGACLAGLLVGLRVGVRANQIAEASVGIMSSSSTENIIRLLESSGKIEPTVLIKLETNGQTDYFIWMAEKADLIPAHEMDTKVAKGEFVYDTLRATAKRTQYDMRLLLNARGSDYRPFYIANKILVRGGDLSLLQEVVSRPDVSRITANHYYQMPELLDIDLNPAQPQAVEDNLIFVNADDVWALGITGQGIVLAGNDSGIDETHPAIARHYRGCLDPPTCSTWDHNYNWWDATGSYPDNPYDGYFHGTWTTGIMVGDDGGTNQIGIAPGSQTIHCRFFNDQGIASDATVSECLEWDLAPWDLNGQNPNPAMAPHAVNNSWGYQWGGQAQFKDEIQALVDAGILVTSVAHNWGPDCSTLTSPGDYHEIFTAGSVSNIGSLPGTLSSFSGRGPSDVDGSPPFYFPDIMAPGEDVRSSVPFPIFNVYYLPGSGTSASGPHVTGLVGLVWEACPNLQGMVDATIALIENTAIPLSGQTGSGCGGDYDSGPNNDWGYGTIDALAAVQYAQSICGDLGYLEGTVYHSPTLTTIENAVITADRVEGGQWSGQSDASGSYAKNLFHGTYTATANAYGYTPQVITNMVVVTGAVTTQDFYLTIEPEYVISGAVSALDGGEPLSATLRVLSTALSPVQTDPATGVYSLTVAEGTYDMRVEAFGYQTARRVINADQDQLQDFTLAAKPCVLLVADDRPPNNIYVNYYTTTLSNLGYEWDLFKSGFAFENGPTYLQMREYPIVIWFSGDTRADYYGAAGPNATDEAHLKTYLDGGGRLFLSSQDYLIARGLSDFGTDYLGISSYLNDVNQTVLVGNPGDFIGDGLGPYTLVPPPNWQGFKPDNVNGVQSSPFRWLGSGENNSTSYLNATFRTVFFAWPLEGLANLNDRSEVLGRVIDYLGGCGPEVELSGVNITGPMNGYIQASHTFTASVSPISVTLPVYYVWQVFGQATVTHTGRLTDTNTYTWTIPGTQVLTVTASNLLGTVTDTHSITITDVPPSGLVATNDSPTPLGGVTTLSATVDTGTNVTYTWDSGDGSALQSGAIVTHTYASVGTYTGTVTATNSGGQVLSSTIVAIVDVPIAGLSAANDGPTILGTPTTLSATITAGTNVSYTWDFGDETGEVGEVVTHTYTEAGAYNAVVTATNSTNTMTATMVVSIMESIESLYLPLIMQGGDGTDEAEPHGSPAKDASSTLLLASAVGIGWWFRRSRKGR